MTNRSSISSRDTDYRREDHSSDTDWSSHCSDTNSYSSRYHTRRSRSRKCRYSTRRKNRKPSPRESRNKNVMERFISAISNHGKNTFIGAHDVIPKFDPSENTQSTKAWLKKVNETANIYKWSDKQTTFHALPKLSGLARRWYEGLSSVNFTWKEWQRKLSQNFPDDRNYADRLSDMLARKTRPQESLEEYFYDKSRLVSRCNIKGKDAVDCIIHGIYDHNIKLNAQGANFKRPSRLLKYLRSINTRKFNKEDRKTAPTGKALTHSIKKNFASRTDTSASPICYNCSEPGHTAPKCRKDPQKCTICSRLGHLAEYCRRGTEKTNTGSNTDNSNKKVNSIMSITAQNKTSNIYNKIVYIDNQKKTAFVDFGSQCTIIKRSVAEDLKLKMCTEDLPIIKGFALGTLQPVGRVYIEITLDFIKAEIDAYVVPDDYLSTDLLVGQNVTEIPDITVYKTNSSLILYSDKSELEKVTVYNVENVVIRNMQIIKIRCNIDYTGPIYVPGTGSYKEGEEFMVLPGLYFIENSVGQIPVITLTDQNVLLKKDRLLARGRAVPISEASGQMKPPNEFEVNTLTLQNCDSFCRPKHDNLITMDLLNIGEDLTQNQQQQLLDLVNEFRDCFALDLDELGMTDITEMHIKLEDNSPVSYKPYRLPYSERLVVRDLINELLESKIVQESNSSYASPIVLVKKKNGEYRLCVDYRALNKKTVKDSYPMPVIDDQLDRLSGKVYFTSLDLKSGYYQIPMAEDSKHLILRNARRALSVHPNAVWTC
jgi:hypothetical protein